MYRNAPSKAHDTCGLAIVLAFRFRVSSSGSRCRALGIGGWGCMVGLIGMIGMIGMIGTIGMLGLIGHFVRFGFWSLWGSSGLWV
jgi:hypothetical protein